MSVQVLHNEVELLMRVAEGDERAFYFFYMHYAPLLRPFILKYTRSESDTEEIIQQTFIKVWLHRDQLPAITNLKGWMYRTGSRIYLNHLRKQEGERKKISGLSYGNEDVTPLSSLQVTEIQRLVYTALDRMPMQRQKIFRISREQGLKPAQIAALLSMPVGTVKNHLSAALKDIRSLLVAAGHDPIILILIIVGML